jgi:DNA-binding NarL/FixJ family response regulator
MKIKCMSVRLAVQADDSLTETGFARLLSEFPEVTILPRERQTFADVRVVACGSLAGAEGAALLAGSEASGAPVVLVAGRIEEQDLELASRARVVAVLRREDATGERLMEQVRLAQARGGDMPPDLAKALLRKELIPENERLAPRERDVLRLMAEGLGNAEIGRELFLSERMVKKTAHRVFARLELRNRQHAVAYAVRSGLI